MSTWSPTAEGFRTIFSRPALSLAEITWRWSFGAAGTFLAVFALFEYFDTLPVSNRDRFLLRTGAPSFVLRALSHILQGSGARFLLALLVTCAALSLLWILLASLGRAATLTSLLETIRTRALSLQRAAMPDVEPENAGAAIAGNLSSHPIRSLAGLHCLRIMVFALAIFALAGALFGSSLLSSRNDPHPGLAFLAFLMLSFLIALAVTSLNWLLSMATLFVVRDGEDSFGAISSAIDLCQDRLGAVFAVGTWFGLAHLTFFVIATSVVGFPLSFLAIVPPGFVLLGVMLVTLLYLAIADSLYIGRLAGYAAILEAPALPPPVFDAPQAFVPPALLAAPQFPVPVIESNPEGSAAVDQSEEILSDTLIESAGRPEPEVDHPLDPSKS
jgi:hypothetical protein